jgi:hypothetical protein
LLHFQGVGGPDDPEHDASRYRRKASHDFHWNYWIGSL